MRSRWYHRPLLHSPALGIEKRATWLELFYDLIFVAAFIQLGNGLSEHVTVPGFLAFAGVFVPLWLSWTGFTFFVNRYTIDDFTHRLLVFAQMLAVGAMAISAPGVLSGQTAAFSLAAGAAQLCVALMHVRSLGVSDDARRYSRYWGAVFLASGLLWLSGAALPAPWTFAPWAAGSLLVLAAPLARPSRLLAERLPLDMEHLGERYALLTLIVLGESFVKVLSALVVEEAGIELYLEAGIVLVITCGLWWVYFDDVGGSRVRKGRGQWVVWLYAHLPLQIAITAVGVAVKKAVHFGWDEPAAASYRWLLAGSVALAFLSVAAIDSVTERRQAELSDRARVNARLVSGALLLVLAPAGRAMSGGLFLGLVTAVTVAQVLFDMMMAPLEQSAHAELGARTTAAIARERTRGGTERPGAARPRRDVSETLRKGTPSALRRDLYFYFMEGSWTRVFVVFAVMFVLANVFFAGLFVLEPGSIGNARPDSFADAFFFSVQTMSSIGYGAMSPTTTYGHTVVTIEAALSVIGIAIVTGLVFAKASRPRSGVLFSKPFVVTRLHGKPTLIFRVGNARGNEVVDAAVSLTVLMDELSPEGHHFRRLHELALIRARSPMFMLSWSIMHVIDEDSPLACVDWDDPDKQLVSIVATLMGHDGTYGQTIYARHIYYCEDLRRDHRFVDVIHELPDGRMMIDYTQFHDTIPDAEATAAIEDRAEETGEPPPETKPDDA